MLLLVDADDNNNKLCVIDEFSEIFQTAAAYDWAAPNGLCVSMVEEERWFSLFSVNTAVAEECPLSKWYIARTKERKKRKLMESNFDWEMIWHGFGLFSGDDFLFFFSFRP